MNTIARKAAQQLVTEGFRRRRHHPRFTSPIDAARRIFFGRGRRCRRDAEDHGC